MQIRNHKLDGRRKYRVYRAGPGDGSTYAQCWGSQATSRGNLVAEGRAQAIERALAEQGGLDDGLDLYAWEAPRWVLIC